MAKDFDIVDSKVTNNTLTLAKASATVIEGGDFVALVAGLAVKATAASASIAYTEGGAGVGETIIDVIVDEDLLLRGTADANFAVTDRAAEVDLVVNANNQEIDLGLSVTDVLKVAPGTKAGTVGSTQDVVVKINKPLF